MKPKFISDFPEAVVGEGADDVLRGEEEGVLRTFIDTTNVGDSRRGSSRKPPLVDEDWHAICQTINKGVEGAEWENLKNKHVEMHKNDKLQAKRSVNKKAKSFVVNKRRHGKWKSLPRPKSAVGGAHEKSNSRAGRSSEAHGRWSRTGSVLRCR